MQLAHVGDTRSPLGMNSSFGKMCVSFSSDVWPTLTIEASSGCKSSCLQTLDTIVCNCNLNINRVIFESPPKHKRFSPGNGKWSSAVIIHVCFKQQLKLGRSQCGAVSCPCATCREINFIGEKDKASSFATTHLSAANSNLSKLQLQLPNVLPLFLRNHHLLRATRAS